METIEPLPGTRTLAGGQRCQVWVADVARGEIVPVHETGDLLLEAPNWTLDGTALVLNGGGLLWRLDLVSGRPAPITIDGLPALNNDHVLHPDGETILASGSDGHVHRAPLAGGTATRLTAPSDEPVSAHYLHGVSPDGTVLASIDVAADGPGRLALIPLDHTAGGEGRVLDTGSGHCDGSEFTPDGQWILLNTEAFTTAPGHAQLARIRPDGTGFTRLRTSADVDWFPHAAPVGSLASFVAFAPGTLGHPEDVEVTLRVVDQADWDTSLLDIALFGGQGSLNVNSWAPDGTRFAFVAYPDRPGRDPVITRTAAAAR
jgi:TolB protein